SAGKSGGISASASAARISSSGAVIGAQGAPNGLGGKASVLTPPIEPLTGYSMLVRAVLRFPSLRLRARLLGFGFLAGDVALRLTLLQLCLAFLAHLVVVSDGADGFLHHALDSLGDTPRAFLRTTVVRHELCSQLCCVFAGVPKCSKG